MLLLQTQQKTSHDNLLKLISDGLGLFVPLKPHHVFCVEPPRLFLQGFGCQILGLSALQQNRDGNRKQSEDKVQ